MGYWPWSDFKIFSTANLYYVDKRLKYREVKKHVQNFTVTRVDLGSGT